MVEQQQKQQQQNNSARFVKKIYVVQNSTELFIKLLLNIT